MTTCTGFALLCPFLETIHEGGHVGSQNRKWDWTQNWPGVILTELGHRTVRGQTKESWKRASQRTATEEPLKHIKNNSSIQFKMVSMLSEKPICAPHRLSLRSFPNVTFETVYNVRLTDDGPLSSFQGRSSSASSFHASVLQEIDGVMLLALCPQVVFQAPQQFRSSAKQASVCAPVMSLHSGMSRAVHPQELKITTATKQPTSVHCGWPLCTGYK